ncbi:MULTISPECIES: c-type cytochrome [Sphingomonas]|uniref:c-type cytochrome n=1 Tax=Sphingomonas TaxID=13687 RepID=UPI000DEF408F|nr:MULTISPECIES: cytochrome c [Sphingomonas]
MDKGRIPDLRRHFPSVTFVLILALAIAAFAGAFIFTGLYNIGADAPHYRPVYMALEQLRDRAIKHHARNIVVPADLNSPARIATGAGLYTEMCTGCHLGPGLEKTEMSQGLYPQAPELALGQDQTAAEQFWTIKHGVKLSAMPAWGKTHDDQLIWDMVAFVRKLPTMSPQQYQQIVKSAPKDHDAMMKDMQGMK